MSKCTQYQINEYLQDVAQQITIKLDEDNFHILYTLINFFDIYIVNSTIPLRGMKFTNLFLCTPMRNPNNFDLGEKTISQYPVRMLLILLMILYQISQKDNSALASINQYSDVICPVIEVKSMLVSHEFKLDKMK